MGPPHGPTPLSVPFSTHLFHLRERKALLVAYPSTSATRLWGKVGRAMAPSGPDVRSSASALSRLQRETRSSMYVDIPHCNLYAHGAAHDYYSPLQFMGCAVCV